MREIKFRGRRIDNGNWVFGGIEVAPHITVIYDNDLPYNNETPVKPETVGQFTGLYDISGDEIYEGDVVRHGYSSVNGEFFNEMPVSFSNNYGGWIVGNYNILTTKNIDKYSIAVIGTIHDDQGGRG